MLEDWQDPESTVPLQASKRILGLHLKGNKKPLSSFKWEWLDEDVCVENITLVIVP